MSPLPMAVPTMRCSLRATVNPNSATRHARLVNLQEKNMAVVVSPGQNEISEMKEKGFDILPHRERMVKEDLEVSGTSNIERPTLNIEVKSARHVAHGLRRAELLDALSGQADARPHANAVSD